MVPPGGIRYVSSHPVPLQARDEATLILDFLKSRDKSVWETWEFRFKKDRDGADDARLNTKNENNVYELPHSRKYVLG